MPHPFNSTTTPESHTIPYGGVPRGGAIVSIKAMQWVFEHSRATGSARVLMLAIADRANDDGVCWPDKANLAKKVNVTERTIIKLVQQCEELGELSVSLFYRGKERRTANRYIMMALAPAEVRATATPVVTVPLPPKMAKDRKRRGLKGEHVITPVNRDAHITPPVNTSSPGGGEHVITRFIS
jgi:hypothetical protein